MSESKSPVAPVSKQPASPTSEGGASVKPTVIMTELDSYIYDRIQSQPGTLEEVEARADVQVKTRAEHRLVLPEYFEKMSYDCTLGTGCSFHKWSYDEDKNRWTQVSRGKFLLRWLFKEKRALDRGTTVLGWTIVSRTFFPDAPRLLFTANGGVEVGDALLAFMPAKKALQIRQDPGKTSRELLKSRMTTLDDHTVLMTGNPNDKNVYVPKLGKEADEEHETAVPGTMVEGRDF